MQRGLLTAAGVILFFAALWYGVRAEQQVECEVCIAFKGWRECRTGRGGSEEEAVRGATTSACAVMGSGVTDAFACDATPPESLTCRPL